MRLPFIWQPAAQEGVIPAEVTKPVGHLDLASTFCAIAGIAEPDYCEGKVLPTSDAVAEEQSREIMLTEWDSEHGHTDMHIKSIYHDEGWLCTVYEPSFMYQGTEGELYDMNNDPGQRVNLWDDAGYRQKREALKAELYQALPEARDPKLKRLAPV
jgi:arylsulfatase A-like enzyme